ncbi:MAG: hypothetical protein OEY59_06960, partial [Deltaproteobacteria bacterium]|nr:hypothetical protein [Deltaproteobacteria bacterium]
MKALKQQVAFKGYPSQRNLKLDPALGLNRGDPLMRKTDPLSGEEGRYQVIGKLENNVSRLQIARHNLTRINRWLFEMRDFLKDLWNQEVDQEVPASVVDHFLLERIAQVRMNAEAASFQGKALLNGKSGVIGRVTGQGLYFVRGSARALSSADPGYVVSISQAASPPKITGTEPLSTKTLAKENLIAIWDGETEFRYKIRPDETPDSLVLNLKNKLAAKGMEVSIDKTDDEKLRLVHHQLGSRPGLKGASMNTRILSQVPGQFLTAEPGLDIAGSIGKEPAQGKGGFLMGKKGNKRTDGIVIYYPGAIHYPGQVVGYCHIKQNGMFVPLDIKEDRAEILSLPSLLPKELAVGVANLSGYMNLSEIKGESAQEKRDALKLIIWTIEELSYLNDELQWKEDYYVELAVKLLKKGPGSNDANDDILHLSKEKAEEMVKQLKNMIE